jgi:hypothetical protein
MRRMLKPRRLGVAVLVAALGAGACAKPRPRTVPAPPPLASTVWTDVLWIGPPVLDPAPVAEWVTEAEAADVERPAEPPAPRPAPHERKVEAPEAKPPAVVGRLGTPETADAEAATRRVRDTVARARAVLATVRVERLKGDARVQYETARQLIDQAEAAVKVANFMYALRLADKAETLAKGLAGGGEPEPPGPVTGATTA